MNGGEEEELNERQVQAIKRAGVSKRLNLTAQKLQNLPQTVVSLDLLQELDLSSNNLSSLPQLDKLTNLEVLKIACNNFMTVPPEIEKLLKLKELSLRNNKLGEFSLVCPPNMEKLDISNNLLAKISSNLGDLSELQELDASSNYIVDLPTLRSLPKLVKLRAGNNKLVCFPEFAEGCTLKELYLFKNQIQKLPDTVSRLTNLIKLDMSENELSEFHPEAFSGLVNLKELDLRANKLTSFPIKYGSLPALTKLSIADNSLESICAGLFDCTSLDTLNLSCNRLPEIPSGMSKLTNLREISFGANLISEIPVDLYSLPNLSILICGYNRIRVIPPELASITGLRILFLSHNKLTKLPVEIGTMKSLRQVYLAHNKLVSVPRTMKQLEKLEIVDLRGNRVKKVPKVLWDLQQMEMLDLSHNERVVDLPDKEKCSEMLEVDMLGTAIREDKQGRHLVGCASMKGRRFNMEDAIVVRPQYRGRWEEDFYGVFDGHGGSQAATIAGKRLHKYIAKRIHKSKHRTNDFRSFSEQVSGVLIDAFKEVNARMNYSNIAKSGTTAVVAYICRDKMFVANVGDSRGVIIKSGKAERLTNDHKPSSRTEEERIRQLGGCVTGDGRLNGSLSVARALGDVDLRPFVDDTPDVTEVDLTPEITHLVLACDGVWDVVTDEMLSKILHKYVDDPVRASSALRDYAYMLNSLDNISVIVVKLYPPQEEVIKM